MKAGDRVRVRDKRAPRFGSEAVVIGVEPSGLLIVSLSNDGDLLWYHPRELELVVKPKQKKLPKLQEI